LFGVLLVVFQIIYFLDHFCYQLLFHLLGTGQAHVGQVELYLCLGMGHLSWCIGYILRAFGQLLNGIDKRHLKHSFAKQPIEFFITHQIGLLQLCHPNLLGDELSGHLSIFNNVLFNHEIINFVKRHISDAMEFQVIGFYGFVLVELVNILFFYCLPPIFDHLDLFAKGWSFVFVLSPFGSRSCGSLSIFSSFSMLSMNS
jgi:hypothetical protein